MIIKSSIHNYSVNFNSIDNIEINDGDYLIIDDYFKGFIQTDNPVYYVKAEEYSKEYSNVTPVINDIISSGFRKNNKIIAVGGGVVQDITGFISSILYRGVKWVFYPTTLLSQGDSCIGGKSSINFKSFKNQLGSFYPPHEIIIDIKFLTTLPKLELYSGIGEMAHYYFIDSEQSFNFFKDYDMGGDLKPLIQKSIEIKKRMIELDEFDVGPRRVFNYGHSFGHAIESITNYNIPHGIAVSYGMDIANYVSLRLGYITKVEYGEMYDVLKRVHKTLSLPKIMINDIIEALKVDKKNVGSSFGLILTKGLGSMFLEQVPPKKLQPILNEYFL
jgi:3-dehydroquinate synthase